MWRDGMNRFMLNRPLDTVGNGTGISNANGNYSTIPQSFKLIAPVDENYTISNILIHIAGTGAFAYTGYGSIMAGLTKGWTIKIFKDGVLRDLFNGQIIKSNQDLQLISNMVTKPAFTGMGDCITVTLSFNQYGMPFYINNPEYIEVLLNDNFTGLTEHKFLVQGHSDKV